MQTQSYPVVAAPALPADLAALVNTRGAPPADPTQRVPPPVTVKPTAKQRAIARRCAQRGDANRRYDLLSSTDAAFQHMQGVA